jgi:hypothetical protein
MNNTKPTFLKTISAMEFMHPLSALLAIAVDTIWTVIEVPAGAVIPFGVVVTSLFMFFFSSIIIFLVQKILAKESSSVSFVKGLVMGVAIAVPFPVFGALSGTASLVGTVSHKLLKSATSQDKSEEIIDATIIEEPPNLNNENN